MGTYGIRLLAVGSMIGILLLSADARAARPACDERVRDVIQTQRSGIQAARFEIIENEVAWCDLWEEVFGTGSTAPPCDTSEIDFSSEVAVVAAQGERSDSCYDIEIVCVDRAGRSGNVTIHVLETEPSGSCVCDFVVVTPLHVVRLERPVRNVRFELTTFVDPC